MSFLISTQISLKFPSKVVIDNKSASCHWLNTDMVDHYGDVIIGAIASQITNLTIIYSTVHSDGDQRKHHSSTSLAFVRGIHRELVNSPHKWPVTRQMFPFDDVIMGRCSIGLFSLSHCFAKQSYCTPFQAPGLGGVNIR